MRCPQGGADVIAKLIILHNTKNLYTIVNWIFKKFFGGVSNNKEWASNSKTTKKLIQRVTESSAQIRGNLSKKLGEEKKTYC